MSENNMFDVDAVKTANKREDEFEKQLASAKGVYMAECKRIREDRKDFREDAKASGVPIKILLKARKRQEFTDAAEAIRNELEDGDDKMLDQLELTLGFTQEEIVEIEERVENAAGS